MLISVVNHTSGKLSDEEVQEGIRAVNRQIMHDFKPHWHLSAELRLEGSVGERPDHEELPELRGDAIIYLWDEVDVDGALGFHDAHASGIPFGFVFTELVKELDEPWTVTLSHEALELIADPEVNLLVAGPHPGDPDKEVFHWYEMCDAVQDEKYKVDGVWVSNFLLPLYFTANMEEGGRNDFLGRAHNGRPLQSFGINPGGYVGFFNPESNEDEVFALRGDANAKRRMAIKGKAQLTRRSKRYTLGAQYMDRVKSAVRRSEAVSDAAEAATARRRAAPPKRSRVRQALSVEMIDHSRDRMGMRGHPEGSGRG